MRIILLGCVCVLLATGCSKQRSSVKGTITFDGKPISGATVTLLDADGQTHRAITEKDGSYQIDGVLRGSVKASIVAPTPRMPPAADADTSDPNGAKKGPPSERPKGLPIDPKYADFDRSGLEFNLKQAVHELSTDLK